MSDLDFSKHIETNSCYSRRLEEVFTEDYPKEIEQDQNRKAGNGESKDQNQEPTERSEIETSESNGESLLSKIKPRIQDCGLNQTHSERIEGNKTRADRSETESAESSECS